VKPRGAKRPPRKPPSAPVQPELLGEHDGVTFQRERLGPILRQVLPLLRRDWEENGVDRDRVPFSLNLDQYLSYDLLGILQIVTARDQGALVGYIFAYVHPHIDHSNMGWAMLTWYWLYPEYRGGGIGDAIAVACDLVPQLGEGAHLPAEVGVQPVPDQDDRGVQGAVRGGDQARVVVFGQAGPLALRRR